MTALPSSLASEAPRRIELPREAFFHGDAPGEPCPAAIDLTGLNRILVYGPFLPLPAGAWRAEVRLALCEHGARRPMRLDFASGQAITAAAVTVGEAGEQRVIVTHEVIAGAPIELRLWLLRPTFHGELRFLGATLERVDSYPMNMPANDASA
jgi:hypothetical protein